MAAKEFHGIIQNNWDNPLIWIKDDVDSGQWQDPWYPSKQDGAGRIQPGHSGEWRSESDGILTGTSGWARWAVRVLDPFSNQPDHFEYVQINWSVPYVGTPTASCGVFRNDPDDSFGVPAPPLLEIVPVKMLDDGTPAWQGQDGSEPLLAQATEVAPYFVAVPWVFPFDFSFVDKPIYGFILRRRAVGQQASPLQFPKDGPSASAKAIAQFAVRTAWAVENGFVGGFPNFYYAQMGINLVGGTILLPQSAGEYRQVPNSVLGNPDLTNFTARMQAASVFAQKNGFVGGFPTCLDQVTSYLHLNGRATREVACGLVLVNGDAAEFKEIKHTDLGSPALTDPEAMFHAVQDYANAHLFAGGFPTMLHRDAYDSILRNGHHGPSYVVCGVVLFKPGSTEWRDIVVVKGPR